MQDCWGHHAVKNLGAEWLKKLLSTQKCTTPTNY